MQIHFFLLQKHHLINPHHLLNIFLQRYYRVLKNINLFLDFLALRIDFLLYNIGIFMGKVKHFFTGKDL